MIDRFGPLPPETENLLQVVAVKGLCRAAGVEKVETGHKGAVVSFRNNHFANPAGLVQFMTANAGTVRLRPDHRLVYSRAWEEPVDRLKGVRYLLGELVKIAAAGNQ